MIATIVQNPHLRMPTPYRFDLCAFCPSTTGEERLFKPHSATLAPRGSVQRLFIPPCNVRHFHRFPANPQRSILVGTRDKTLFVNLRNLRTNESLNSLIRPVLCYAVPMKKTAVKTRQAAAPFIKRKATIVFEANTPHKGSAKAVACVADFNLSKDDLGIYTSLFDHFCRVGKPIVSMSAQEIANIMPPAVFMEALPRLEKAGILSVSFWEHRAASPNLWRKVKSL